MPTLFLSFLLALFLATKTPAAFSHNQQLRQELDQIMKLPDQLASVQNVEKILDVSEEKIKDEETSDEISTQSSSTERRRIRKNGQNHPKPVLENNDGDISEDPFEVEPSDTSANLSDDKRRKRKFR